MDNDQVNTELVDTIVREVKSQGLFDQFRKECLADVDTKPAYQNLRQRVENEVNTFLEQEEWRADANRIQMREKLRKNIIGLSFLETGVDRIVDQVVNPKISTVFLPQIEDVVYKYLGIEKPQVKPKEESQVSAAQNGEMKMDLLPTDLLEAVSPDSTQSDKSKFSGEEIKEEITEEEVVPELNESDDRIDDEESPPFEPLEGRPASSLKKEEDESQSSHVSGISGLTSQDSVFSGKNPTEPMEVDEVKPEEPEQPEEVMQPPRIDQMVEKSEVPERTVSDVVEAMEVGNQDSQLSQVSSNSRLSIVTNESDSKDGSLKIDLSEEAQMPEFSENPENSQSPKPEKLTTFDIKKDEIKFEQTRIFAQPPEPENPPPLPPSPPPQLPAPPESEPAKTEAKEEVSSTVEKKPDNPEDRESRKDKLHTSDRKKSKKSSRSSSSHHNHHHRERNREKSRASSSREKSSRPPEPKTDAKEEENSSTAIDSDASPVLQIVETETLDGEDLAKATPSDGKEKSDGKSKGSSHHKTSHRDDKKRSHSSHSKDSHRRDHRRHDHRKSSSQKSSSRSDKKPKEDSSSKKKDKETDDHSSQREKNTEKRRSTDRDSNDGKSGPNQPTPSASGTEKTTASQSTSSAGRESNTTSVSNSPKDTETIQGAKSEATVASSSSDPSEKVTLQTKPIIVDQILTANSEINLQMIVNRASNDPTLAKIEELAKKSLAKKKPKFASNFKEAKRLMKMRKKIDHESKKNMEKAMVLAKNYINSKAENDPTVSDLSQGIELEFVCIKSDGKTTAGPIISSPVKADAPKFPPTPEPEKKETSADSEDEDDLLYFPDPLSKHPESPTEKWWREKGQKVSEEKPKSDQKTKKTPKNGLIHANPNIRTKRSLELNDLKGDLPEDKRVKLTLNKFGDLNGNEAIIEDKKIPKVKTPITQQQRYSSDDLYKPRPLIHGQRSRRRGLDTSDGGTA
uniref:BOD1/SHG1 domain-containing protein n=1 Tax=Phlebotomus papatasi TaxID=29031 RepID=A0A1B0DQV5_PHLPP